MWKINEGQRGDEVVTVDSNGFLCNTQLEVIVVAQWDQSPFLTLHVLQEDDGV